MRKWAWRIYFSDKNTTFKVPKKSPDNEDLIVANLDKRIDKVKKKQKHLTDEFQLSTYKIETSIFKYQRQQGTKPLHKRQYSLPSSLSNAQSMPTDNTKSTKEQVRREIKSWFIGNSRRILTKMSGMNSETD